MSMFSDRRSKSVLLVGASRGLGLAMAGEFVAKGWRVVGTVRGGGRTGLHDLAEAHGDRVRIVPLDIMVPAQIVALRKDLDGSEFVPIR